MFLTLSCAEFDWNELVKKTYETVHKKKIDIEFIEKQEPAWKNKIISSNVVQSTVHFAKRTDKIMTLLSLDGIFQHEDVWFHADSYFYRVEFQARGAPHIHCLLWLKGKNGETPPSLWESDINEDNEITTKLSSFGGSIISGSAKDMHCASHNQCDEIY